MAASAMCSDGSWLNGRSNPANAANMRPHRPSTAGRSNEKRSGTRTKQAIGDQLRRQQALRMRVELAPRRADKERQSVQRSIDQYGRIVHAQNGMPVSQAKVTDGTSARCAADQFASQ